MIKIIYKTFSYIFYTILICALVFFSVYLIKRITNKDQITSVAGISFFEVATGSMRPEIVEGDLVVIQKKKSSYYQAEMIITFLPDGAKTPVTHKIVKRENDTLITRGINNNTDDDPIDVSCVLGEVIFVWKDYYKFAEFIKSPIGIVTIIVGGIVIVEGLSLINKKLVNKEPIKKKELETE